MVGAALCVFYLLLLSISEFIGFSWAYLIAAVASTLLITWYCRFFLGGGVRTFMIGAGLAGVYLFLYITLRQQDYALLMGAIALFVVLAIVMYVTRKVDWYARTPPKAPRRLAQKITQRYFCYCASICRISTRNSKRSSKERSRMRSVWVKRIVRDRGSSGRRESLPPTTRLRRFVVGA